LVALERFFLTNSLTWLELVAAKNDLAPLTETAKNLKSFLKRLVNFRSPLVLAKETKNIGDWAGDLLRLVAHLFTVRCPFPYSARMPYRLYHF
jgi:hypothetical protein